MSEPTRFACVLLVDRRGWVLLQERDEHAAIDPETWGMPGGHVEDGEGFEEAAYRELAEETGVRLAPGELQFWREFATEHASYGVGSMQVYVAEVDLTDDDIVCGEGRRIVFVDPAVVPRLELTGSTYDALPAFLSSELYSTMAP
ncbi:NUDIX domain-containing protein [Nocardioides marmotae]|uniref:NUDIX domain-containing protein n=1 Tax=Nocardioides marmotae TaxID=2663857 RepID=UPI0012B5A3E2|nr:NUDIX hydrolase [Nocardioides marmotae]MBC9731913.1 NUDIX hydrolase [Nocardioides marmotae]MTB83033.1 NUDIX domain-containing protein [Nocardioides marmotae]